MAPNSAYPESDERSSEPMNPWKTLSSTTVYDNPWIRVEDHRVINPSGNPGQYGKVCFKNRAIAILPLDAHGNVHLVGQFRYTLERYSWELPKGGAPLTEDPLEAAQRELREETGLTAARWRRLLELDLSNSVTDEVGVVYVAEDLKQGDAAPEETEDLTSKSLSLREALDWVRTGKILDAISVAGLLRLAAEAPAPSSRSPGE